MVLRTLSDATRAELLTLAPAYLPPRAAHAVVNHVGETSTTREMRNTESSAAQVGLAARKTGWQARVVMRECVG